MILNKRTCDGNMNQKRVMGGYSRAVGSSFPLVRRVIELGKPILENVRGACSASARGVWGHAPPGNFFDFWTI